MHSGANLQTPRSLRSVGNAVFGSPSLVMRTPQTQTGMGTRAFLLPPPSPCSPRRVRSAVPECPPPTARADSGTMKQESSSDRKDADQDKVSKEDVISHEPDDVLLPDDILIAPGPSSSTRRYMGDSQGTSKLGGISPNDDTPQGGDGYASSPLPPSSPLPASPFSSPTKHHDSDIEVPTIDNLLVPDSDILLPSASDSDGPKRKVDTTWLSDDACATSWLTETDAWLTDTEGGGPLLTDSDGTWLSDSEAVFGDMSSLPPSSASNWFSDDADIDTDWDGRAMKGRDGAFDTVAFESVFSAFVEHGGQSAIGQDVGGINGGVYGTKEIDSELWESMRSLLGGNTLDGAGTAIGDVGETVDGAKVAQDIQELIKGLVGT